MRAAVLLSGLFIICGMAALFGVPAVYVSGRPILGVLGFVTALTSAVVPPLVILGWRKVSGK
jgi:hypothetical protein